MVQLGRKRLAFHSFSFEVFDLPALDGERDDLERAGEIMTIAVGAAGSTIARLATERVPDGLLTRAELDALNVDLQRMAERLAVAVSARTDAPWWVEDQARFTDEQAYDVILGTDDTAMGTKHASIDRS